MAENAEYDREAEMKRLWIRLCSALLCALLLTAGVRAETGGKLIALTFDDGPGEPTERLLDGLKERGVKATFFMLGECAEAYPDTVARVYREGHQIANHSYDHAHLDRLADAQVTNEFASAAEVLNRLSGGASDFVVRLPYGVGDAHILSLTGAPAIGWSVDPMDWKYRDAETVRRNIVSGAFDGAIVLVHDIHPTSVDGALLAVDDLRGAGYEFVTVRELFRRRGVSLQAGSSYRSCGPNGTDRGPVPQPVITGWEEGGRFTVSVSAGEGVPVWYTTNGTDPLYAGNRYAGPFPVEGEVTVRATAAYCLNGSRGPEASAVLGKPRCAEPVLTVADGKLVLSSSDPAAVLRYTLDGQPVSSASKIYEGPVPLSPDTVIRAAASRADRLDSGEVSGWYSDRGNFFRDADPGAWYADAADRGTAEGWFRGTGNGCFSPDGVLTRSQTVTLLYRFAGEPEPASSHPFADVSRDGETAAAVSWAYSLGIVAGRSADRFFPDDPVTRQEIAVILDRYFENTDALPERGAADRTGRDGFADGDAIAPWAKDAAERMRALGLLTGDGEGRFRPVSGCTRAEMAVILCRAAARAAGEQT